MDIGKRKKTYTVEPLVNPVPQRAPASPVEAPKTPAPAPERKEPVPA